MRECGAQKREERLNGLELLLVSDNLDPESRKNVSMALDVVRGDQELLLLSDTNSDSEDVDGGRRGMFLTHPLPFVSEAFDRCKRLADDFQAARTVGHPRRKPRRIGAPDRERPRPTLAETGLPVELYEWAMQTVSDDSGVARAEADVTRIGAKDTIDGDGRREVHKLESTSTSEETTRRRGVHDTAEARGDG